MPTKQYTEARGEFETDERWTAIDEYTVSHLHPPTRPNHAVITYAAENSAAKGLDDIATSAAIGKFLALQCRMLKAKHVLEFGTLGGYSAVWMATENPDLTITTLEYDTNNAEVAEENFLKAGVAERIECIVGPAVDALPRLYEEVESGQKPRIDFAFIDADKLNNWTYFDWTVKMSRPGACIVVDNVVSKGKLADAEEGKENDMVKGGREVVEKVGKDSRVEATVLQIVGIKDYDGFLMAVVK